MHTLPPEDLVTFARCPQGESRFGGWRQALTAGPACRGGGGPGCGEAGHSRLVLGRGGQGRAGLAASHPPPAPRWCRPSGGAGGPHAGAASVRPRARPPRGQPLPASRPSERQRPPGAPRRGAAGAGASVRSRGRPRHAKPGERPATARGGGRAATRGDRVLWV